MQYFCCLKLVAASTDLAINAVRAGRMVRAQEILNWCIAALGNDRVIDFILSQGGWVSDSTLHQF